jgi:toprim domain protein
MKSGMQNRHSQGTKVIIVEGKTDRERLQKILDEPVRIVCTYGTLSYDKIEEVILPLQNEDVYILVDADDSGMKLRNQLKQELPNARHLYTRRTYKEVARTPYEHLARVLADAHFQVDERYLLMLDGTSFED